MGGYDLNATRHDNESTTDNLGALIAQIKSPSSDVRLFATHRNMPMEESGKGDRAPLWTNLPLLCALAYDGRRWIVYDGNFLTAARPPRASEISVLLDVAVEAGTVLFCSSPVDFTGHTMTAEDAAAYLKELPTQHLTADNRGDFSKLISVDSTL